MSSAVSSHDRRLTATYVRWSALQAALGRGYWLVTSLYLVLDARLRPEQLVLIGVGQAVASMLFEVPTGVVADTVSRRLSLMIAHVLVGLSMIATALSTSFAALLATQILWGIGWTFASGADVAWITDELEESEHAPRVLTAQARWKQIGALVGMIGLGGLAWIGGRAGAMLTAGAVMAALAAYVAIQFPERRFRRTTTRRVRRAFEVLKAGLSLTRRDIQLLILFGATILINGAFDSIGRLFPRQLIAIGFPTSPDPIVWFTALSLAAFALGAFALWIVEQRLHGLRVARAAYVSACGLTVGGALLLAAAPGVPLASLGVLLMEGIGWPVTRAVGAIWANERATREVRATIQSLLAQMEYAGEMVCGLAIAWLAGSVSISVALTGAAALVALAGLLALRSFGRGHGA